MASEILDPIPDKPLSHARSMTPSLVAAPHYIKFATGPLPRDRPTISIREMVLDGTPSEQLRRYLVEIIRFTFDVNATKLTEALATGSKSAANDKDASILSEKEKYQLLHLSILIKELHQKCCENEWNTTLQKDSNTLYRAIVVPACELDIDGAYTLDLISTYADHQCNPQLRKHTLVSRSSPSSRWKFWESSNQMYISWTLESHMKIISHVSPNESTKLVLDRGLTQFQKEKGYKASKYTRYEHPTRDGYRALKTVLQDSTGIVNGNSKNASNEFLRGINARTTRSFRPSETDQGDPAVSMRTLPASVQTILRNPPIS